MRTSEIIGYLKSEGYEVKNSITNEMFGKVCVLEATKGKLIKTKLCIFVVELFEPKNEKALIDFVEKTNGKNALCAVLCNINESCDSLIERTTYMSDHGDFTSITHFVYYVLNDKSFVYDLDFSYFQSKNIKKLISYSIEHDGPFCIDGAEI